MSTTHTTLGSAAEERKARLAKLKSLKRKQPNDETSSEQPPPISGHDVSKLHLSGRNYDTETKGPKLGFDSRPDLASDKTLEQQAKIIEEEIRVKSQEGQEDSVVDLFKLQPKKPNWDLKRDLEKKLDILNVRTDNAIARLVHNRVKGAQTESKLQPNSNTIKDKGGWEDIGMDGASFLEGVKQRERETVEDEKREKEEQTKWK
ncbi:BgTH12-00586 [Blumeria graminis f. sp. triticale]|uniref:Bgt-2087 n=3 Tax=Blumeria graminis TaxID=34373 RepID=A0A061HDW1_BLUGR|nr:hypothetical protein BGT96224_2087 [Blumeria graminis f. sp. tritici 96224]CAD6505088.1 BgTH12-00586 [Blumeria graminis f. sp. triticale]VDB93091.1 Bgt-2087 [Blumeria graminis f. sp. tritici]